ncbi:MAG: transglutaminase-like domain-containing protein [Pirellulaceae bacterium]
MPRRNEKPKSPLMTLLCSKHCNFISRACCLSLLIVSATLFGQEEKSTSQPSVDDERVAFTDVEAPNVWEFGLELSSVGKCEAIQAFAPLPSNWPEQTIEIVDEMKTDQVDVKIAELQHNTRLIQIQIDVLLTGQTARAVAKCVVRKKNIVAPRDPAALTFAKNVKGDLKAFLQESPYIEIGNSKVKKLAASIELDSQKTPWQQVESIYEAIREKFPYEFDPTIRSCPEAIENGKGDCEELTSLFIAVCRIKKIPARAVWIPGHTYAEFYLIDSSGVGQWYPCQLAGTRQFGEMQESRPILQKGDKFQVPLSPKPVRYIAPQLVAKEGACTLTWIAKQVESAKDKK